MLLRVIFATCLVVTVTAINKVISKGKWTVDKTDKCPDNEQYEYQIDLHKNKVNRTHDGFTLELETFEEFTEDGFGFALETCMKMDGGCKTMHQYSDESFCRICADYAKNNFERALINIGVEPHCPVPKDAYKLDNFVFDNRELPDEGMVGSWEATIWITRGLVKIACFRLHLTFTSDDDAVDDALDEDFHDEAVGDMLR